MMANLSLVLDEYANVRLDILENVKLSEIDKYTTQFNDSNDIREANEDIISEYLNCNSYYADKGPYKNGAIVVTYIDEFNKVRRLRVLYKKDIKRLNPSDMIKNIRRVLLEKNNPDFTFSFIERYVPFIFGSPNEKRILIDNDKIIGINDVIDKKVNKNLINYIICPNLRNKLKADEEKKDRELAYFHIRILDAYLHKNGIETTKMYIETKRGSIEKNYNIPLKTTIKKESKGTIIKQEGDFYLEDNGQYNMFNDSVDTKKHKTSKNEQIFEEDIEEYDDWQEWKEEEKRYER